MCSRDGDYLKIFIIYHSPIEFMLSFHDSLYEDLDACLANETLNKIIIRKHLKIHPVSTTCSNVGSKSALISVAISPIY
jgi:hypothetical protein